MISEQQALEIHSILVERFGGSDGIRDKALLESALNRPFQTFDGTELYPSAIEKAAAIMESIVKNHPFVDGNKRTGYVLGRLLLMTDQFDITAEQDQKYEFVINISTGKLDFEQIKEWIKKNSG
ncbi:MAG: type II toxin-antitoxin system death-on-curing family toxin [Cyclobacteriaceae bacterium]